MQTLHSQLINKLQEGFGKSRALSFFSLSRYNIVMNFLHYYNPDPIIFSLSFISVRWYGFLIALALAVCLGVILRIAKKINMHSDTVYDLVTWLVVGGVVGARLYEVLFINLSYYLTSPLSVLKIWEGGLAIHGGIIGGVIALFIWTKLNRESFWKIADLTVVVLPLGQAIGRWGNYFNGELYGKPTDLSIGIPIDISRRIAGFEIYAYFHPAFLYESLLNLILFIILFFVYKKSVLKAGSVTMLYLIGYSLIRFFLEFIRIDPTPVYLGLKLPQLVSLIIIVFAISFLLTRKTADTVSD